MITIYADDHALHHGRGELNEGRFVPCYERPERAWLIRDRVIEVGLGEIVAPRDHGRAPIERVHAPEFVGFLETAWTMWAATGRDADALATGWATRHFRQSLPSHIDGLLGFYGFDAGTPITAGTWRAAYAGAQVALTGAGLLSEGRGAAFALCRPPGHHAASDLYGGYCYLNNAAITAQRLLDAGAKRVAVLDVDYHHGNGTQAIFYDRADVLFVSLHADPDHEFPYFLGRADERGAGAGEGRTLNLPLPFGTGFAAWSEALEAACHAVADYAPEALVVSLGVDTYEGDPISRFRLRSDDFGRCGARLARLGLPTLFVMEGGYAIEPLGVNAVNVLTGFEGG